MGSGLVSRSTDLNDHARAVHDCVELDGTVEEMRAGTKLRSCEILSLIRECGMGEVWKARYTRFDRSPLPSAP
jgi:hypothetical protein